MTARARRQPLLGLSVEQGSLSTEPLGVLSETGAPAHALQELLVHLGRTQPLDSSGGL